jgi:hypothetical protein
MVTPLPPPPSPPPYLAVVALFLLSFDGGWQTATVDSNRRGTLLLSLSHRRRRDDNGRWAAPSLTACGKLDPALVRLNSVCGGRHRRLLTPAPHLLVHGNGYGARECRWRHSLMWWAQDGEKSSSGSALIKFCTIRTLLADSPHVSRYRSCLLVGLACRDYDCRHDMGRLRHVRRKRREAAKDTG